MTDRATAVKKDVLSIPLDELERMKEDIRKSILAKRKCQACGALAVVEGVCGICGTTDAESHSQNPDRR